MDILINFMASDFATWLKEVFEWLNESYENILTFGDQFIETYSGWGPLAWIFAAWFESVFPILMLSLITVINITAAKLVFGDIFGWIFGFLLTWVGTTLGAITMFTFWRYISDRFRYFKNKKIKHNDAQIIQHESNKGVIGLFSLSVIPLLPSSIINFTYAFTKMKTKTFITTTVIAKFFMMLLMSIFANFFDWLFADLLRGLISIVVIGLISFFLNRHEDKMVNFVKSLAFKFQFLKNLDDKTK